MTEYYDPDTYPKEWNYLQTGTIIDQYMIERELAHGGFSSVYLARQLSDQTQVAIKEYLPRKLAHRTWNNLVVANNEESQSFFMRGRALFFEEAKVLSTLKHPNIVEVTNFFKANDTVYMVMTYDYGVTMDKILSTKMLPVTEQFLVSVFSSLLAGLAHIHQHKLIHLDIKPSNVLVRPGNDALLLDFGAIQSYPISHTSKQSKVLTKGFSPIEQHDLNAQLGPWTDLYAVGASMRACLDCKTPIASPDRAKLDTLVPAAKAFKRKFPEYLLNAIDWAMALQPQQRPQSVEQLQRALEGN
ncbi:MAG: serine/threonine-protein kinase [Methylococcales bacterium]|nr:serine/threonine protein kinase [Methylococcaceae bacterium]